MSAGAKRPFPAPLPIRVGALNAAPQPHASWWANSACCNPTGLRGLLGAYPSSLNAFNQPPSPKASNAKSRGWVSTRGLSNSLGRAIDRSLPVAASTSTA